MLESIRGATGGFILKFFAVIIIASFVLVGLADFVFTGNNVAASVGKVKISSAKVAEEVRRQAASVRQMFGGQVPDEMLKAMNIEAMVIRQMVQEELLRQGAENLNIKVDDRIVTDLIAGNPAFRNGQGKFDRDKFRQILASNGQSEAGYIASMKDNISTMFVVQAVAADTSIPDIKLKAIHAINDQKRIADTVRITAQSVKLPAVPDAATLQKFYDENKADFALPESRSVSYITFSEKDVGKEDAAEALYALANKAEDLLAGGATLEEISKNLDIKLQKVEKIQASAAPKDVPDAENFVRVAFGVAQGEVSPLTLTQDQKTYYAVRVDGITPITEQPLAKIRDALIAKWKVEELERLMKAKAENIAQRMDKGEKLSAIAAAEKLTVTRSKPILKNGNPEGLPAEFVQQLFQTSKGLVKGVYPASGSGYIVGELVGVEAATPLDAKTAAALKAQLQEEQFNELLSQYTLYLQQKTPVKITAKANREAE